MKHSFDEKCLELAEYFYPHAKKEWLDDLARQLQGVIESAEDVAPERGRVISSTLLVYQTKEQANAETRLIENGISSVSEWAEKNRVIR